MNDFSHDEQQRKLKTFLRRFFIVFGGFVLLIILIGGIVFFSLPSLCSNEILAEELSPDGKLKAVIFTRNCGATTGYNRQVSILRVSETLPNDGGNVFITDDEPTLLVRWSDNTNLTISGGGLKSPFAVPGFPGVFVTYR